METSPSLGRLLITGAPGWLTDAFIEALASNPLTGVTSVRAMALPGQARSRTYGVDVEWVEGDLRDAEAVARAADGVDSVLHAAGVLHVSRIREFYDVNTDGTLRLAEAVRKAGGRRFVFVSSNAAAGRAPRRDVLLKESDPAKPLNDYGRSKLLAEQRLLALGGLEVVNLRPCMFYGPPVPPRHVEIYNRILSGRMPMVGTGDYARSIIYIDSLVEACRLALTHPAATGQTYFIADPEIYTTRAIVDAMARALGVVPRYLALPAIAAPTAFVVDSLIARMGRYWRDVHLVGEADWNVGVSVEKARRELGFQSGVKLDEGMSRAIAWCRERGLLETRR